MYYGLSRREQAAQFLFQANKRIARKFSNQTLAEQVCVAWRKAFIFTDDNVCAMPTQDEILVLLEEVARTNRTLNNENRLLREELARRDVENKVVLKKLEEKIDSVTSSSENGSPLAIKNVRRRRTKKVRVPAQCRVGSWSN